MDCGRYRDGGSKQDETIDSSIVQGIRQALINDILILGKANQQVPNRSLNEDDMSTHACVRSVWTNSCDEGIQMAVWMGFGMS